jgi:hypothetical protein
MQHVNEFAQGECRQGSSVGFVIEIEYYVRVWCWIGRPLGRDWVCV